MTTTPSPTVRRESNRVDQTIAEQHRQIEQAQAHMSEARSGPQLQATPEAVKPLKTFKL